MTTIPLQGNQIKYSDIQKAFGGKDSNSFNIADVANSLNTANNYTISGLSLDNSGNIYNVKRITANTFSSTDTLNIETTNPYNGNILFNTNYTERMRISETIVSATGNVGIGSTIPKKQLDVNNNINAIEYFIKGVNISNIFISRNYLRSLIITNSNVSGTLIYTLRRCDIT